jgi:hypothetical protein
MVKTQVAKPKRARRPKKGAQGDGLQEIGAQEIGVQVAVRKSRKIASPALDTVHTAEPAFGPHLAGVQSSDTALSDIEPPIEAAMETNDADRPWPLWEHAAPVKPSKFAWLSRLRVRPLSPMAATIAIAACCGAMTGSLATVGVAKFLPLDVVTSSRTDEDLAQQVARLDAELVMLRASLGATAKADTPRVVATAERSDQPTTSVAIETTGSISDAPSPIATVPVAPPVIIPVVEGWVLRNVYGGSALVEGRPGLIQVMPGDSLPGVGRVETIKREGGRWVVVTTRGLIVAR